MGKEGRVALPFFIDRSLGHRTVEAALTAAGIASERHDRHFAQDAPDPVWLAAVGARGWPVITADGKIRYRGAEKQAVIDHRVAMFIVVAKGMKGEAIGALLVAAAPRMLAFLSKTPRPFIARITARGDVRLVDIESG